MFDKRLLSLVPGIMPLIVGSVAAKWIALLCNIAIIATIGNVFAALLAGDAGVRNWLWCGGCGRGGVRRSRGDDACDADHRPRYFDLCGPARRR